MNPFSSDPDLVDDLVDEWPNRLHRQERRAMLEWLQSFALHRRVRVSFISGDSHCAAVGRVCSTKGERGGVHDERMMVNVTSSAIVNKPPPKGLIAAWHVSAMLSMSAVEGKRSGPKRSPRKINPDTAQELVKVC